jgi:twinfilin-like protein
VLGLAGELTRETKKQRIDPESEEVKLVPSDAKPSTLPELVQSISATEPRFTFFRFAHEHAGASSSPILFFYTCPAATGRPAIKARMLYPLMKRAVLEIAEKDAGIAAEKKFEFEDPSEITEEAVLGELHPKPAERKGFSRPKRPGR